MASVFLSGISLNTWAPELIKALLPGGGPHFTRASANGNAPDADVIKTADI